MSQTVVDENLDEKTKSQTKVCLVLVRAFGGEPVVLEIRSIGPKTAILARSGGKAVIGIPVSDIYTLDDVLFLGLQDAHGRGDVDALRRLWATAKPFTSPHEAAA